MLSRSLRGLSFLVLLVALLLASSASPVLAGSLVVSPASGLPGTTFLVQGSGFRAFEAVQLWSQYPDNRIIQLSTSNADGGGSAAFQVKTDSSFPFGSYVLLAHGLSSGANVYGNLFVGTAGNSSVVTGSAFCQGQNFTVPGFSSGERVAFTVKLPNGKVQVLGTIGADGSGNATFTLPVKPGLPTGNYVINAQGLSSGHQTSDTLTFDGSTLTGGKCSVSVGGSVPGGIAVGAVPRNIVQYRGPGVYSNTNPNQLYYAGCDSKWWGMNGLVYMLVLGFKPNEQVNVSYEILGIQGRTSYATVTANAYGNVPFGVNTIPMTAGHYHWWFTSPSASYCGHYDHVP